MSGRHSFLLLTAALEFLCGCASAPDPVFQSTWYQGQLNEAKEYNEAKKDTAVSREIWIGTVRAIYSYGLFVEEHSCLYSAEKGFFGGYCKEAGSGYFELKTQFLKSPPECGDRIIFTAEHYVGKKMSTFHVVFNSPTGGCIHQYDWLSLFSSSKSYSHLIDGSRMAKVDPATGTLIPLEYDSAAL
ncbi:MAG: hypothetical protein J5944_05080 [Lentisphaeria bacterium]|nr:hypothetical protein [Lentisphaeria bacterium]